jgi:hypothetical protein
MSYQLSAISLPFPASVFFSFLEPRTSLLFFPGNRQYGRCTIFPLSIPQSEKVHPASGNQSFIPQSAFRIPHSKDPAP